jgi:hypothetical protein
MFSIVVITFCFIAVFIASAAVGYYLGLHYKRVNEWLQRVDKDINRWKSQEEEANNESAIVETTPQIIREKVRKGEEPNEESAIVTTKSPQEVRKAKNLKLQKELDNYGR